MLNILIVEDEKDIVEVIEYNLKKEGFKVSKAFDGKKGLKLAQDKRPALIILDLMLPELDGLEVCKKLKGDVRTAEIPVIMLTAKGSEIDRILGLELGADDYITKPFSLRELIARVKAILKRCSQKANESQSVLRFADLEIDIDRHEIKSFGKIVELTAKEFALLRYLAENKDLVMSREKLLDYVWGIEVAIETRTVDVHVRRLREKLGKSGSHIKTLRGVGYKFV
ncbi:DNA-binding response regulator [candidate division WOR-1 bacterium RIFOXYB2_FULL_42_35]|uniref:DNA-binding response regulator n=1 Tax=candidate division WOR-1 bacterium RIFOXYC2_FULL_41_25 TaxID=1802586 RepID=A0A1F4TM47_UNCSA|nr:MAG: DNA-binding response regulator [candidate division WOR-1 bacterium RIFOXYA2_FULL_41_14]OGC23891.1 MAG: DNA-binding response regulator [candidate division WOR-1 bacterium RIFOXYB2_FULL_42_35]OGC33766.1 MAG: DNA-binding response regulator [candidate division WOR-1 bacterium RIFOXYC2_FULL_41_25]OGC44187.1 MAG: DNA-binding response regulator [candidate division WOR-1 bacterium RIFOXYD2_FULL_41_8]